MGKGEKSIEITHQPEMDIKKATFKEGGFRVFGCVGSLDYLRCCQFRRETAANASKAKDISASACHWFTGTG